MEQETKYIRIGLENVEIIDIDIKNIKYMCIHGITNRDTISKSHKKVVSDKYCQSLHISIYKKADKKYPTYGGLSEMTIFERLYEHNDIIDISYLDENKKEIKQIYVPWKSLTPSGEENANQFCRCDKDGDLEILIKE